MTTCDRFEREGLLLLEQGRPLGEHFSTCPDCLRSRAAHEALQGEIVQAAAGLQPAPDWKARVCEKIRAVEDEGERIPRAAQPAYAALGGHGAPEVLPVPWFRRLAVLGAMAAAALAVAFVVFWSVAPPVPLGLELYVAQASGQRGGAQGAQPGDTLVLRAGVAGAEHWELRLYRNDDELVMRCSTEAPCIRRGRTVEASVELDSLGEYQAVLIAGAELPPAPEGSLDIDVSRAASAGFDVELEELTVR